METTTPETKQQKLEAAPPKKAHVWRWITIVLAIILLGGAGYLGWFAWNLHSQNTQLTKDKSTAQSQITDLNKQLTAAKRATPATTSNAPCPCTPVAASDSLKANIHDAINSKNTAALEGYMASSVKVVIAASEHSVTDTPAQAVAELDYLNSSSSPWNFSIAAATLTSWKAHFYGQYFSATSYAGEAASGQVASFDFDCNGKIDQIFMAANADLLTQ